ncbi:hypothetical protein [Ferroplasma sp.]|uniref:hypothetical protein n=1 Tax=Ferroplasma sp. TaxID=2591003 RepID=UPI002603434C|nr:hypothetical protein [Ferroplasma sp.]
MNNVVSVRINSEVLALINRLISLGIAKNKTEAVNYILNYGIISVKKTIQTRENAKRLLEKYLREGLPDLPPGLSDISIRERE